MYDDQFKLQTDILESYQVEGGKVFTFKLRPGHKWSDGHPFTTEDFRFYWEDIANNKELSSSGPPAVMLVDGKPPRVEILDETTIRYSWDALNPYFIELQAQAAPLFLFRPAHYLKKFHIKYTDADEIAKSAKGAQANISSRTRSWTGAPRPPSKPGSRPPCDGCRSTVLRSGSTSSTTQRRPPKMM